MKTLASVIQCCSPHRNTLITSDSVSRHKQTVVFSSPEQSMQPKGFDTNTVNVKGPISNVLKSKQNNRIQTDTCGVNCVESGSWHTQLTRCILWTIKTKGNRWDGKKKKKKKLSDKMKSKQKNTKQLKTIPKPLLDIHSLRWYFHRVS